MVDPALPHDLEDYLKELAEALHQEGHSPAKIGQIIEGTRIFWMELAKKLVNQHD